MNKFDWIVWYLIGIQALSLFLSFMLDGRPKKGYYSMKDWVIGFIIALPFFGRVLGWW